jgi:nitrogen regulatory protein P-II 1
MKKIEAVIREEKLEQVHREMEMHGVHGMTTISAHGFGAQVGPTAMYRGAEHRTDFTPRVKLEIIVDDALAERVVDTIFQNAHTGQIGDGRIIVTNLESVTHIRTGETYGSLGEADDHLSVSPRSSSLQPAASPTLQHSV